MEEYTNFYLRKKGTPMVELKEYPKFNQTRDMTLEEIAEMKQNIEKHNKKAIESFGCRIIHLDTIDSKLEVLPNTEVPLPLSMEMLKRVISYYDEELETISLSITRIKDKVRRLEERISKTKVELYDKISKEIEQCHGWLILRNEELEEQQSYRSKFLGCKVCGS